jgi:hypothetical protein
VARQAEESVNWLLNLVAVLSLTVPLGLTVAQFQRPWPAEALIPVGIVLSIALTFGLFALLERRLR